MVPVLSPESDATFCFLSEGTNSTLMRLSPWLLASGSGCPHNRGGNRGGEFV